MSANPPTAFHVVSSKPFESDVKKLTKRNKQLLQIVKDLLAELRRDPYTGIGVSKLTDVKHGEGQYRIRSGNYRIRFDIDNHNVIPHSFTHRKDTY